MRHGRVPSPTPAQSAHDLYYEPADSLNTPAYRRPLPLVAAAHASSSLARPLSEFYAAAGAEAQWQHPESQPPHRGGGVAEGMKTRAEDIHSRGLNGGGIELRGGLVASSTHSNACTDFVVSPAAVPELLKAWEIPRELFTGR